MVGACQYAIEMERKANGDGNVRPSLNRTSAARVVQTEKGMAPHRLARRRHESKDRRYPSKVARRRLECKARASEVSSWWWWSPRSVSLPFSSSSLLSPLCALQLQRSGVKCCSTSIYQPLARLSLCRLARHFFNQAPFSSQRVLQ